jgi:hypothetical protein
MIIRLVFLYIARTQDSDVLALHISRNRRKNNKSQDRSLLTEISYDHVYVAD